ncbi:hypothetical protein [Helicobacter mesocricetorum]|uniref:hypothetical protein n=1 Tax=Helicobacter mesocricetorum TaxID=87012 RepID=UPI000CF0450C|nr:hypothetical protein [Helicobacter mesocricetorum]
MNYCLRYSLYHLISINKSYSMWSRFKTLLESRKESDAFKVFFYFHIFIETLFLIISLIFFDTKWWQFLGMLVIMLERVLIFLCYHYKAHTKFFIVQGSRSYFYRFYSWVDIYFFAIFCFFCPMFVE